MSVPPRQPEIKDENAPRGYRCATCRYCIKEDATCHRGAPQLVVLLDRDNNITKLTLWPQIPYSQWCGEYSPELK